MGPRPRSRDGKQIGPGGRIQPAVCSRWSATPESDFARASERECGSFRLAPEFQSRADLFRALPHPQQAPVPVAAPRLNHFRLDSFSIVANQHSKQAILVPDVSLDLPGLCVPERISQQFTTEKRADWPFVVPCVSVEGAYNSMRLQRFFKEH